MFLALSILSSPAAHAGTLTIEKRGIMPALVWVDGVSKGKVKRKKPLQQDVVNGSHEVWVAIERSGVVTRCHGVVDVPPEGLTVSISGG